MRDEQQQPNDGRQAARDLSEDLEPTDEIATEITAGNPAAGSPNISDLTITKLVDK
jgi:hypothetical protein